MRNADDGGLQNGRHRFLANVYPVWLTNINVNTNRERWRGHWERWPRPSAVRRQATTRGGSLSCRKINNGRCHPKSLAAVGTKNFGCAVHDWANGSADCRLTADPPQFISIPTASATFVWPSTGCCWLVVRGGTPTSTDDSTPARHFRWH